MRYSKTKYSDCLAQHMAGRWLFDVDDVASNESSGSAITPILPSQALALAAYLQSAFLMYVEGNGAKLFSQILFLSLQLEQLLV